jgi:hypothetical protein
MMFRVVYLALALGTLALSTAAHAFTIDPQCQIMQDKIGCTCALQTGGRIATKKGGYWWETPKTNIFAFQQCTTAARGK